MIGLSLANSLYISPAHPPKPEFTRPSNAGLAAFSECLSGMLSLGFKANCNAVVDALLFHPEDGPAIISTPEVDMEEVCGEVRVCNRLTGHGFIVKGTFATLRDEWRQNNIMYEEAVALYEMLVQKTGDLLAAGEGVIEMVKDIQAHLNNGTLQEEIITSSIERLGEFCPDTLQEPTNANEFILRLIKLTSSPLAEIGESSSQLFNSIENPVEKFVQAVRDLTRLSQPVFGLPPEIEAHMVGYIDNRALWAMRLVSVAAHHQAERLITWHLNFNDLWCGGKSIYPWCAYFEQVNVPTLSIKFDNIARHPDLFAQFITSLVKNKHVVDIQLDLSYCALGDDTQALSIITQALSRLPHLTTLNFRGNRLGSEGAELVSGLRNVKNLDISRNNLMDEAAVFISTMSNLMSLDISHNLINSTGAGVIFNMDLTSMDISGNRIERCWVGFNAF